MNGSIEYIVNRYSDMIYRLAFAYLSCAADAEDIVSEVLMKYFSRYKEQPISNEKHLKLWLTRVTINACKDVLKSARVKTSVSFKSSLDIASENMIDEELDTRLDIEAALDSLPSDYRIVLFLYYYRECSTKEIAKLLNIPKNTVVSRLSRGRKMLSQKLRGYEDNEQGVIHEHA